MKRLGPVLAASLVLVATRAIPAAVPAAAPQNSQSAQFRAASDLVEVYATAMSRNGAGVHDLRGDEFELFEDGKRRDITVFSAMVQPLSVALVLDHSGSTDTEFAQIVQASGEFIGRLFKEDRASVSTLGWDCAPFTSDRAKLVEALQTRFPRDPGSPIWSAVDRGMTSLVPEPGRHVLLLLSDGIDNQAEIVNSVNTRPAASSNPAAAAPPKKPGDVPTTCAKANVSELRTLRDVMDRAERETVMVYTVAVPTRDPSGGVAIGPGSNGTGTATALNPPLLDRDPRTELSRFSRRSGGSMHELSNYAQLKAAFKVIADELHLQYLLGFVPTKFDGERHQITVRVKREGVTVRARESYRAKIR